MRSLCSVLLVSLAALGGLTGVAARPMWGVLGHYMTAAIAEGFLSTNASNACANLLPTVNGQISLIASWADDTARDLYPWSPQLHYINTPDWNCTYVQTRDCFGGDDQAPMACVDGAIQNYTARLVADQISPEQMTEALMFLVHFIGDIHQPLHVGFTGDEGGNTEYGTFEGTSNRRLHQVWDEDMLEKRINDDYQGDNTTYLQYYLNRLESGDWKSKVSEWRECSNPNEPQNACSIEWANESVAYACSTGYTDQDGNQIQNGFDLEDPYYNFAYPVAELQIAKGGIRLANVLNTIFALPSMARYTVPQEEYSQVPRVATA